MPFCGPFADHYKRRIKRVAKSAAILAVVFSFALLWQIRPADPVRPGPLWERDQ